MGFMRLCDMTERDAFNLMLECYPEFYNPGDYFLDLYNQEYDQEEEKEEE